MLLALVALLSTKPAPFPLTVKSVMRGPALVGHAPQNLRWRDNGQLLTFSWAKADGRGDPSPKIYAVDLSGRFVEVPREFNADYPGPQPPLVMIRAGDVFLLDASKNMIQLTKTEDLETNPSLTLGGSAVVFVRSGKLYRIDIADKRETFLVDIPPSDPPNDDRRALDYLAGEQRSIFKGVDLPSGATPELGASRGRSGNEIAYSPNGGLAVLSVTKSAVGAKSTFVPAYVTKSGFTEVLPGYPKVGAPNRSNRYVVVNIGTGKTTAIEPPRPSKIGGLRWSPDGKWGVTWAFANDHKDAWLYCVNSESGDVRTLYTEHSDAWTGGPGAGVLGWYPDSSKLYIESENTGFANLLAIDPASGQTTTVVGGEFEVSDVRLDAPHSRFVFVSSEGSPFRRHIDTIPLTGGKREKLSEFSADEDATFAFAPNGKDLAVVRSKPNRPAELYINDKQITTTPTEEWLAGPWIVPLTVFIPARDGVKVPARLYKPKTWRKGGAAVIFVHGAGYLQNVYEGWSHYYREYMFHHILMDRGYMVLDVDYRGSAGYGRAWRTAIYRHMGGVDLTDQVDGAAWLVKQQGVDPKRIGIYGGSYGGFITLMAMFKAPETFAAGAALRPVVDWANYDDDYTSEILNRPQDDPEAYRQSSPIYFADGLKGSLLICHGMVDTNVHFQDSVRLVQKLIDLGKQNWEVAPYPIEDHAFTRPESWTDEYTRILNLFEHTIGKKR